MPRQVIGVIGALSDDTILLTKRSLFQTGSVDAAHKNELGGRAAIVAISIARSFRQAPDTDDGLLPEDHVDKRDDDTPEVRVVGAVADENRQDMFSSWLRRNGVNVEGVQVVEGESTDQDKLTSLSDGSTGRSQSLNSKGVSQNWTVEHFDTVEKLGGGKRPDLVVLTMELRRDVVEHIIQLASDEGVTLLVYAAPGTVLLGERYRQIEHFIGSEGDAAVILGYEAEELTVDVWPEMCEQLHSHKGIKNVVIKTGYYGAFFKNDIDEGFVSGYQSLGDVVDSSGGS